MEQHNPNNRRKIQFAVYVKFEHDVKVEQGDDGAVEVQYKEWYVSNCAMEYYDEFLLQGAEKLDEKIANYSALSSGYRINKILHVDFILSKYETMNHLCGH